ncbi:MAG: hypothetical protein HY558_01320 [Euryarchaeota archaeon]|nr:hypothetical protein [Euryarchaeota archaeon]
MSSDSRVSSGVPGLDDLVEGGYVPGRTILVSGGAGTGKTTFCIQFLVEGVRRGEPGLLVTMGENKRHIVDYMARFGWDLKRMASENKLGLVDASPLPKGISGKFHIADQPSAEFTLDTVSGLIHGEIKRLKVKRVVLDSVTALLLTTSSEFTLRHELLALVEMLESTGATALLTSETLEGSRHAQDLSGFVTHGLIELEYPRIGNEHVRTLTVRKMRGTNHDRGVYLYEIGAGGIRITSKAEYLE